MADLITFTKTADFAAKKHRDQRRKDKESSPYINHPIGVAYLATSLGGVTDLVTLQVRLETVHQYA
jgi:guanosine-3',5'-bis(diphosphate) 3'-pyrophosphohydrolase